MTAIVRFDSIAELRQFAARPTPANRAMHAQFNSNQADGKEPRDWFGVPSYAAVQEIFDNGWPAGVARMLDDLRNIETPAKATRIKRRKIRGDQGDEFDWQAAAQGMHDVAWTHPVPRVVATPRTVTLVCDLAADTSHTTHADEFFWRGAAVLFLTDALSEAGYNVQVIAAFRQEFMNEEKQTEQFNVAVKQPNMPVDLSALASSLCLAAFARVLMFSAICARSTTPLRPGLCYAHPAILARGEFGVCAHNLDSARQAVQTTLAAIEGTT